MVETEIVINLESPDQYPNLPLRISGYAVLWTAVENTEAQNNRTIIGTIDVPLDTNLIENMAEELYRLARKLRQDCIAMKVTGDANLSRTVGPFAHLWPYDDSRIIIG